MEHKDKVNAILQIRPNAEFVLLGDELEWLDKEQTQPTDKEIQDGLTAYKKTQTADAKAKETAKAAILDRIGLTADELQTILG
jgi:hypothetical protein